MREVKPVRDEYRWMFPNCQRCGKKATDIHEITAGGARRQTALDKRALLLSLCRCCHSMIQGWRHTQQLHLKMIVDREGYDLDTYRRVMRGKDGRPDAVIVTQEDVDRDVA